VFISSRMEIGTKENGKTVSSMVKAANSFKMEMCILDITAMGSLKGMGSLFRLTDPYTKVIS